MIVCAAGILWVDRREMITHVADALQPQTLFIARLTLVTATTLHEFAHGPTCKHFGGEVREVGLLPMFFLRCFYCNASDVWLFREKSNRARGSRAGQSVNL